MTKKGGFHVTPGKKDGWDVKRAGSERASSTHDTQKEAFEQARAQAKSEKTSVRVHGKDGKIREERSYGNETDKPG